MVRFNVIDGGVLLALPEIEEGEDGRFSSELSALQKQLEFLRSSQDEGISVLEMIRNEIESVTAEIEKIKKARSKKKSAKAS